MHLYQEVSEEKRPNKLTNNRGCTNPGRHPYLAHCFSVSSAPDKQKSVPIATMLTTHMLYICRAMYLTRSLIVNSPRYGCTQSRQGAICTFQACHSIECSVWGKKCHLPSFGFSALKRTDEDGMVCYNINIVICSALDSEVSSTLQCLLSKNDSMVKYSYKLIGFPHIFKGQIQGGINKLQGAFMMEFTGVSTLIKLN